MTVRYESVVGSVGELVPQFIEQGILVFFDESAPKELHDFAVLHKPVVNTGGIAVGDTVRIGDAAMTVLAVGDVADQNLVQLGHLDLKANGLTEAPMPGDVCVAAGPLPPIGAGTRWLIESSSESETL